MSAPITIYTLPDIATAGMEVEVVDGMPTFTAPPYQVTGPPGPAGPAGPAGVPGSLGSLVGYAGMADLQAETAHVLYQTAKLLFAIVEGDGGAGDYYYSDVSTQTPGIDAIKPNDVSGAGRWIRL